MLQMNQPMQPMNNAMPIHSNASPSMQLPAGMTPSNAPNQPFSQPSFGFNPQMNTAANGFANPSFNSFGSPMLQQQQPLNNQMNNFQQQPFGAFAPPSQLQPAAPFNKY